jgi:RNA recognition motif-containing protein
MNTKMYVGNLPFTATEAEIRNLFSGYGEVTDLHLPMDRDSDRPRGFAFVTMDNPQSMSGAIAGLNAREWNGRVLAVNEARPREDRGDGPSGGNRIARKLPWRQ